MLLKLLWCQQLNSFINCVLKCARCFSYSLSFTEWMLLCGICIGYLLSLLLIWLISRRLANGSSLSMSKSLMYVSLIFSCCLIYCIKFLQYEHINILALECTGFSQLWQMAAEIWWQLYFKRLFFFVGSWFVLMSPDKIVLCVALVLL